VISSCILNIKLIHQFLDKNIRNAIHFYHLMFFTAGKVLFAVNHNQMVNLSFRPSQVSWWVGLLKERVVDQWCRYLCRGVCYFSRCIHIQVVYMELIMINSITGGSGSYGLVVIYTNGEGMGFGIYRTNLL